MKIKICGVSNTDDAQRISDAGADYIGMIFAPKSPRFAERAEAEKIAAADLESKLVGVFVDSPLDEVIAAVREYNLHAVQLHGSEDAGYIKKLSACGAKIWKTVWLLSQEDISRAENISCDAVLVDAVSGGLRGGTGRLADWSLAAKLAAARKVVLAGGISFENAFEAYKTVKPVCLDLNSSVEISPRKKDAAKISKYLKTLKLYENI